MQANSPNGLRSITQSVRRALAFERGTKRAYRNYGFILLGALIRELSGLSYDDDVDRHVDARAA